MMITRSAMVLVFCAALLIIGAVFLAPRLAERTYAEAYAIAQDVRSFDDLADRFRTLAREKGASYAFEILKRAPLPPNTDIHLLGHAVGDELYMQKGTAGIALCTQDFRNACSHSVVIGALNEFGEAALPEIRDACTKAPGGSGAYTMCYHGLGHGVFAYFGYAIPETVAFCEKTGTAAFNNREAIECVGGMIMELMGGGGHNQEAWARARARYLSASAPLRVCLDDSIPRDAKTTCMAYLTPYLWEQAGIYIGQPDPALFPKAFAFCDHIPRSEQDLRAACFGGFGKEFVPLVGARDVRSLSSYSGTQYETIYTWCAHAGHSEGINACVVDALASFFWGGENDPNISFTFCESVSRQDSSAGGACFSALAENITSYVSGDARERECSRLPETYQPLCTL